MGKHRFHNENEYNQWYRTTPQYRLATQRHSRKQKDERKGVIADAKKDGCILCGYNKCKTALEFHHVGDKSFAIADEKKSASKVISELTKCIVVCANCHREIHAGQIEGYEDVRRAVPMPEEPPLLRLINS